MVIYRECREILIPYPGPDLKYNHYYCFKVWLRSSTWDYQEQSSKWLPWENCWHLVMPLTVSPPNDMWETCAEIPYWWCVTTQIWVVTRHQYGISALVSLSSFGGETSGSIAKCRLFSQASKWSEWVSNWRLRIPRSALWTLGHAASNDTYTERPGLLQQSVPLVQ